MAFDTNQAAYTAFRDTLKQRVQPVLIWSGAGLSLPAGLPTWSRLRKKLLDAAATQTPHLTGGEAKRFQGLVQAAEHTDNLWEAFAYLKQAFLPTSFAAEIRSALLVPKTVSVPSLYEEFWKLGIRGYLNLNLDRFATRAFGEAFPGHDLAEFQGVDARYQADILRGGSPFVANLHGITDVERSWVFTPEDFDALLRTPGFKEFVTTCFLACTVRFVGISADDRAAGGHLARLREKGLALRGHYWLTDRADQGTHAWAEETGVRQIFYATPGGNHREINDFVSDLRRYLPQDPPVEPVLPSTRRERNVVIASPEDVEKLTSEEIRQILNKEAIRILSTQDPNKLADYATFLDKYSEAIHRAWSVSSKPGKNAFFGYQLLQPLAGGAFGQVYRATDKDGNNVAIKILHGNIKDNPQMLQGFRRGVKAMQILSDRSVQGMVPYIARWEIPAATVMHFVDGANLEQAIEWNYITTWEDILPVVADLIKVIRAAHTVPEHVLHRDIRPPNVMLRNSEAGGNSWEVVVLDFDLSWHKGAADVSIDLRNTANGYMAPEQADTERKDISRNALVDSFGVGMTLFYLVTRSHPQFGQQRHADWSKILSDRIGAKRCAIWVSLPRRIARLVEWATKDIQSQRWDLSRISGEIDRLLERLTKRAPIRSSELLAEEIAARCADMAGIYEWDVDKLLAGIALRSGFSVHLKGDEAAQIIALEIDWSNAGDRQFEQVRKYVGPAADKAVAALKTGSWKVASQDKSVTASSVRITATTPVSAFSSDSAITKTAESVSAAIHALRLS